MVEEWKPKRIWNLWEHQRGWGHNLTLDWDHRSVIGHLPNRRHMSGDDEFRCKMESGKVARFRIRELFFYGDPPDMVRFKLEDAGYLEGEAHPEALLNVPIKGTFIV